MKDIFVLNKWHHHGKKECPGFINVMRGSILGNRFQMENNSHEERHRVVCLYHEWLRKEYKAKGIIYNELNRIADLFEKNINIYFECCCAPKECHGDILKLAIKGIIAKRKK